MASSQQAPYNNPPEIATINPREFYPDGIMESWLNPILVKSWRPGGSAFAGNSDYRKTVVDAKRPGTKDRHRQGTGFAEDVTGNPWGSTDPGWTMGGGPQGPGSPLESHESHPVNTQDPRAQTGILAQSQPQNNPNWLSAIQGFWQASPVAALFFGLAGLFVINSLLLKNRTVSRTTTNVGNVASAPGRATQGVGEKAMDEINDAVGDAVKAVDDITPGS